MFRRGISGLWISVLLLLTALAWGLSARASSVDAVWPECSGADVRADGRLEIDASHMDMGYIMARTTKATKRGLKLRVSRGETQLNYDLNGGGDYETFPLQMGSGKYEVSLFENVKGNKYSSEGKVSLDVKLSNENAAFLAPNQYVNYELWTSAVQKSDELCADQPAQKVYEAVSKFMSTEFMYDFVRAKTIPSSALPEIDYCYENRMGICQDLAAVAVCMLRVQGVPAKLVIGYADDYYHAWCSVIMDGQEVMFDPTHALGAMNARTYTTEREY